MLLCCVGCRVMFQMTMSVVIDLRTGLEMSLRCVGCRVMFQMTMSVVIDLRTG